MSRLLCLSFAAMLVSCAPESPDAAEVWLDGANADALEGGGSCTVSRWYIDADGDHWGDSSDFVWSTSCRFPGRTRRKGDCDDGDGAIHKGAREICDGLDNDCDGATDDDDRRIYGGTTVYLDWDGDGYGDPDESERVCSPGSAYVSDDTDCDDGDASINPGEADDTIDGVDNDCDGSVDEDAPTYVWQDLYDTIFNVECAGCHTGGGASGGLSLEAAGNIISVPEGSTGVSYIEPHDTAASYLYLKLTGDQTSVSGGGGAQMPKGSAPMDSALISMVETWILEGAPE